MRSTRLVATLAALLGALATALAIVGVYGTIAYAVSRRRHEIGIRFALGAARADIVGLVLRQGPPSILGGIAAEILFTAAVARFLRGMLFGFSPIDPIAFLIAGVLLIGVAILATLQPARKAAGIDPASALRAD